jgi:hypothetical protein
MFTRPPQVDFAFLKAKPGELANGTPTAKTIRLAARRAAQLKEAADVLSCLPGPGEALHALMTGRYDLMHLSRVAKVF